MEWEGDSYQARFDALAARGEDVHGEAAFVAALGPESVLDAGCGTGRVAIELARRGIDVVGVDADASMLATAQARAPGLTWIAHDLATLDLATLDLGRTFSVVVMAGNVPIFTPAGTEAALVAGCAAHVGSGGALVAGFQLGRGYEIADYDAHCAAAGLELEGRWSTWAAAPFTATSGYAVSLHRRPT
jgi:2-polyprenyl-3-methyl-5-hydroxy-6-metoxy-1,4-benzoquinol methylase